MNCLNLSNILKCLNLKANFYIKRLAIYTKTNRDCPNLRIKHFAFKSFSEATQL